MPITNSAAYPFKMQSSISTGELRERVIPRISDVAADKANCDAIDRLIGACRYPYIVAWGKFLGFTAETVKEHVEEAEADNAPVEAIQKFDDEWSLVPGISNETNRRRVMELARR